MKNKYVVFSYTSATPKKIYESRTEAIKWVKQERNKRGTYKNEFKVLRIKY